MKQINLLPTKLKVKEEKRRLSVLLALALACGLALPVGIWQYSRTETDWIRSILQENRSTKNSQNFESGSSTGISGADTTERINQINSYSKTEVDWKKVFAKVGALVSQDVYLNSLTYALMPAQNSLTFKMGGSVSSNVNFATFVESLKQSPDLQEYRVESYSYDPKSGVVSFSLSGKISTNILDFLDDTVSKKSKP